MDLDSIKLSTLSVLSEITENELSTVTLPILRGKVAEAMKLPIEELLGKEIKAIILGTFQEFLLSKSEENPDDEVIEKTESEFKEHSPKSPKKKTESVEIKAKDNVKARVKDTTSKSENKTDKSDKFVATSKPDKMAAKVEKVIEKATGKVEKVTEKSTGKAENVTDKAAGKIEKVTEKESPSKKVAAVASTPTKTTPSAKSLQIERLKSYVFKCGVRKVWKKELEGLNENQCIAKIQGILKELGIEGKPSLEQCKTIKARREFEAELKEIDSSNIIEGKRRRGSDMNQNNVTKRKLVISDDDEEEGEGSESDGTLIIDLKNIGDSESD